MKSHQQNKWQMDMNASTRKHLNAKIIEIIFGINENDSNVTHCSNSFSFVDYVTQLEMEIYEYARNLDEYLYLLAERIYKISRVLHEVKRKNIKRVNLNENVTKITKLKRLSSKSISNNTQHPMLKRIRII